MKNMTKYNIFILISTFSRSLIELFSSLILYKIGFNIKEIILFYIIYYLIATVTSILSLKSSNKLNSKFILIFSSIMYAISFYYLSTLKNNLISLIIFGSLLSISNYTYHPIRHLYASILLNKNKTKNTKIGNILIFNYIAVMLSSYLGPYITNHFGLNIVIVIIIITSLLSIIPLTNISIKNKKKLIKTISFKQINKNKLKFFIFEQYKVIFLLLQPLYIYIYINKNIEYIGIINVIFAFTSILTIYIFSKKSINKFRLINTLLCLILIIKINITNTNILLIIAILEGIGIKTFEVVSTKNIYNIEKTDITSYLITAEIIFCLTSSAIFTFFFFLNSLKTMLYISIIFIFLCGFINLKIDKQ